MRRPTNPATPRMIRVKPAIISSPSVVRPVVVEAFVLFLILRFLPSAPLPNYYKQDTDGDFKKVSQQTDNVGEC